MGSKIEKSAGNPVVIIDLATGAIAQGVLNGVSERGPNKVLSYSIQATEDPPAITAIYSRKPREARCYKDDPSEEAKWEVSTILT